MSKEFPMCPYCGRSGEPIELLDEVMKTQMKLRTQLAAQAALLAECSSIIQRCNHAFDSMRHVDKYHLLYGEADSIELIQRDITALLPRLEAVKEGK
jgi:hypothetical protein